MFYSPYTVNWVETIEKLGDGDGLETGADVDGGGVVFSVAQSFGMLEHLVGRGSERQRLLQLVSQAQRQLQVLLQMLKRQMCREAGFNYSCKQNKVYGKWTDLALQ